MVSRSFSYNSLIYAFSKHFTNEYYFLSKFNMGKYFNSLKPGGPFSSCKSAQCDLGHHLEPLPWVSCECCHPQPPPRPLGIEQNRWGSLCTLQWWLWHRLFSAPSPRQTLPGVPSLSGWATAHSPEDSSPGTPGYPLHCFLSVAPTDKSSLSEPTSYTASQSTPIIAITYKPTQTRGTFTPNWI